MDIERAVVSKIVSTGQIEEAVSKGLRAEHFADEECREMFSYILDHVRSYKVAPSTNALRLVRPHFELIHTSDPLDFLIDRFIAIVKRRYAQDMAVELARRADNPECKDIDLQFLEVSRQLATMVPSTQVHRFVGDMDKRIADYERRVRDGIPTGVSFGFPQLDAWTGGIQPHEFCTIAGFSGIGKSTLLMVIAFNAWMKGHTPLYISLEMEARSIARKWDAMAASLDYQKLKQLALPPSAVKDWRDYREKAVTSSSEIPIIDSIRSCTPDHIFAETVRHKPDLVLVDYLSLMRTARPTRNNSLWQSLTEITQDLKQNARTLGIPIIAAAQTNRGGSKDGAELDNIGYSISVVQDADIVIGLYADDEMKERREMEIRLNKNRDGKIGRFPTMWDHENMRFREKTPQEYFQRRQDGNNNG